MTVNTLALLFAYMVAVVAIFGYFFERRISRLERTQYAVAAVAKTACSPEEMVDVLSALTELDTAVRRCRRAKTVLAINTASDEIRAAAQRLTDLGRSDLVQLVVPLDSPEKPAHA